MTRKSRQQPVPIRSQIDVPASVHVLERFSASDLDTWNKRSDELNALHNELYHGLEPERVRRRDELINALNSKASAPFDFSGWVRMVGYRYSNDPLSAAGSVRSIGGRFNIGNDCDDSRSAAVFPALYLGDAHETAFREFYQTGTAETVAMGLTPAELGLRRSDTTVMVCGHLEKIFDARDVANLRPVAKVFSKFQVPPQLAQLAKSLRLGKPESLLIKSAARLQHNIQELNWRAWPQQFGLPSPSQRFGQLLHMAGYEAILYRSTKLPGSTCVAVFPSNISSDRTFVELEDVPPDALKIRRLDITTAEHQCGWEFVRKNDQFR